MTKKDVFALDIGSGSLRGAYAKIDENQNIIVSNICQHNYGGYSAGELLEPDKFQDELAKVITSLMEATNKKIKNIVVGVPSQFCAIEVKKVDKYFDKPTLVTDNIISLILQEQKMNTEIEGAKILHSDKIFFCDQTGQKISSPIGKTEMQISLQISLCYAMENFCNFIENCLTNCGVEKVNFISAPLAQAQSLFPSSSRDEGLVFMDNGCITSFVASIKGDGLTSLTSFDLGGIHITEVLMNNLGLTYSQAQDLKTKLILTINPIELDFYENAEQNGVQSIPARQVNRYVKLKIQKFSDMVKRIGQDIEPSWVGDFTFYITGNGVASIKGAREMLQENLESNVEIVHSSVMNMDNLSLSSLGSIIYYHFKHNLDNENIWTKIMKFFKKF